MRCEEGETRSDNNILRVFAVSDAIDGDGGGGTNFRDEYDGEKESQREGDETGADEDN